jgi:hypothetical protein
MSPPRASHPTVVTPWTILASLSSNAEREQVVIGAGSLARVQFCPEGRELHKWLFDPRVAMAVLEPHCHSAVDLHAIAEAVQRRPIPIIALLWQFDMRGTAGRQLLELNRVVAELHVSLRGFDDLAEVVGRVLRRTLEDDAPRMAIVSRLSADLPSAALDVVLAAAILGGRHTSVRTLASFLRLSSRRVEERLETLGLLSPKRLLMWTLVSFTSFRITTLGWTAKAAAVGAGFSSARALSNSIERTIGLRLAKLSAVAAFADILEEFANALQSRRPSELG